MKRLLTIGFLLTSSIIFSQQLPQYTQYQRNQLLVNPAAAGAYDFLDVTIGGRYQWMGFGNNETQGNISPRTAYLYAANVLKNEKVRYNPALRISNGPIRNPDKGTGKLKHALGLQAVADSYGAFQNLQIAGMYAIHIPLSRKVNMSFGAKLGLSNHSFLPENAQVLNSGDQAYDNFISNGTSRWFMDLGAGFYVYSNKFFLGVSSDQLTTDLVSLGTGTTNFMPEMHFTATGGYKFDLNDDWTLQPSAIVKLMPPAPISLDGTLQVEYKEWLWFGTSYRYNMSRIGTSTNALTGMLGANISQRFKIGYSYDYSLGGFQSYATGGGHELMLGLMIR